jgi:hypothetical protein
MPRKISKSDREAQLSALALADGYEFVGWVGEYKNSSTKAVMRCTAHGDWSALFNNLIKGSRCIGCRNEVYSTNRRKNVTEVEDRIRVLTTEKNLTFVKWCSEYKNKNTRLIVNCATHGSWEVSVSNFLRGTGCDGCGGHYKYSQVEREAQVRDLCVDTHYSFIGWETHYQDQRSKVIVKCSLHGNWSANIGNFIDKGTRCAACASTGYDTGRPGTLYALLSECETMVKIGISNRHVKRRQKLARVTPFKFSVHREIHCDDGAVPRMLERLFHNQFPSAGLKGFDGATEWRQMSPDITTWLELLK